MSKTKKILFICALWLVLLIIAELAVRGYYWGTGKTWPAYDYDISHEWEWAERHLQAKKAVFDSPFLCYDPQVGWKNKPGVTLDKASTNSQGMRNATEFSKDKPPGKQRILFVGDSYTFGLHVAEELIFTSLLAKKMPAWEVLNMAVSGTGTDQQLLTYELSGKEYSPDIVILGFFVYDYKRNLVSFRRYAKPTFVLDGGEIRLVNAPVIAPQQLYDEYVSGKRRIAPWYHSYLYNATAFAIQKNMRRSFHESAYGFKILGYMMERFQKSANSAGTVPIWLIIPARDTMEESPSRYVKIEDFCEKKSRELGMLHLRLDKIFHRHEGSQLYRDPDKGGHLSSKGHEVAAQAIYKFLQDNGLAK